MIVDAGPLYPYVDADDTHHGRSLALLRTHPGPLIVPTQVVTEVAYLLGSRLGAGPTADRRHCSFVRPQHIPAFTLLP